MQRAFDHRPQGRLPPEPGQLPLRTRRNRRPISTAAHRSRSTRRSRPPRTVLDRFAGTRGRQSDRAAASAAAELLDREDGDGDPAARLSASTRPPPKGCRPAPTPSSAKGPKTRSPARPPRRSAPSRSRRPCCRPTRSPAKSSSVSSSAVTRLRATSTGSSSTPSRPVTGSRCGCWATSAPIRPPVSFRRRSPTLPQVAFSSFQLQLRTAATSVPLTQPADLRPEYDDDPDLALVGQRRRDAVGRHDPDQRAGRRRLRENDGGTALRARLHRAAGQHRGACLHALHGQPDSPAGTAGAQRRRRHPAAGRDREARRRPLLPARGHRGGRRQGWRGGEEKRQPARTKAWSASPRFSPAPEPRR